MAWAWRWIAAALALAAPAAWAHEDGVKKCEAGVYPCLVGDIGARLRFDTVLDTQSAGDRHRNSVYVDEGEVGLGLLFNDWLSLQTLVKGGPLRTPRPRRDDFFYGWGFFVEQAYVNLDFDRVEVFAGKIKPTFGIAWPGERGIFIPEFAEDYEFDGQIGFGVALKGDFSERGLGKHELTGQVFFHDNTFLHTSYLTRPKVGQSTADYVSNSRKSHGGPGNTNRLDNFSVTLDGGGFDFLPALNYHLGYRQLAKGVTETRVERAFAIGFDGVWEIGEGPLPGKNELKPLVEYVRFTGYGGQPGRADYWSAGLALSNGEEPGAWELALGATLRRIHGVPGESARTDRLLAATVSWRLDEIWSIGAGYKWVRESGATSHVVGLKIAIDWHFAAALR